MENFWWNWPKTLQVGRHRMTYLMICTDFLYLSLNHLGSYQSTDTVTNRLRWLGDHDKIAADTDPCLSILGHVVPKATHISPIWDRDGAEISGAGGGGTDSVDKVAVEGWLLLTWLHWWGITKRKQKLKKKFTTCEFCLTFRGVLGFPTIFGVV